MRCSLTIALSMLTSFAFNQELAITEINNREPTNTESASFVKQEAPSIHYSIDYALLKQKGNADPDNPTRVGILVQNTIRRSYRNSNWARTALSTKGNDGTSNAKYIIGYSILGGAIGIPIGFVVGGFKAITHKKELTTQ